MTMTKEAMLEYLRKRRTQLEDAISKYLDIDLNDAADIAAQELKVVDAKIKELEAKAQ